MTMRTDSDRTDLAERLGDLRDLPAEEAAQRFLDV
jgi:hypothetical protein